MKGTSYIASNKIVPLLVICFAFQLVGVFQSLYSEWMFIVHCSLLHIYRSAAWYLTGSYIVSFYWMGGCITMSAINSLLFVVDE